MTFDHFLMPPENIRWFFRPIGVDTMKYKPFRGYDSIRLEAKFRESVTQLFSRESLAELVVVRDGLFEANIKEGNCLPIYWDSERMTVTSDSSSWMKSFIIRGTWFRTDTWQPLPEKLSEEIDAIYRNFGAIEKVTQVSSANKKVAIMHSLQADKGFVRFLDDGKVYLDESATLHYFRSKFTMEKGIKLSRGYKELANIEDKPLDISHLVFVVHGIGQTFGSIQNDNWKMRNSSVNCFAKHFGNNGQRTEFLPVEWRTSLELDEAAIHSVTLAHCQPFRVLFNSIALDILYYTSPMHRMEIMRAFYHEVIRLYSMFCSRNPYFEESGGKVSILAHSLGAVVAFDVLTGSTPSSSTTTYFQSINIALEAKASPVKPVSPHSQLIEMERTLIQQKPNRSNRCCSKFLDANIPSNFRSGDFWKPFPKNDIGAGTFRQIDDLEVVNLFCLGSPLAVFLALRGIRPLTPPSAGQYVCPEESHHETSDVDSSISSEVSSPAGSSSAANTYENFQSGNPFFPTTHPQFADDRHLHYSNANFRLFNIFHPRDIVAYRIEPLILQHYVNVSPVMIGNPNRIKRGPSVLEKPPYKTVKWSSGFNLRTTKRVPSSSDLTPPMNTSSTSSLSSEPLCKDEGSSKEVSITATNEVIPVRRKASNSIAMNWLAAYLKRVQATPDSPFMSISEKFTCDRLVPLPSEQRLTSRIDFEIEEDPMGNILWGIFTSHWSYWTSEAFAFFLLSQLYGAPNVQKNDP